MAPRHHEQGAQGPPPPRRRRRRELPTPLRRPLLKPAEATKLRAAVRELDAFIVLAATPDVFETVAFPEQPRQQTVEAIWCTPPAHTPARADEGRLRYQSVAALRRMDSMDHAPTA